MIFNVLILLFSLISILLIYSLLIATMNEKAHDSGIMRLMGLHKFGFAMTIVLQAILFALPSLIIGYLLSYPCLYFTYQKLF